MNALRRKNCSGDTLPLVAGRPVAGLVVLALALACCAHAGAAVPAPLVVLPPGEGNTITLSAFGANQASGDCADLGRHTCDQLQMYEDWRFRPEPLAPTAADVPTPESDEQPEPGVRIVRDQWGVPHVYADGPDLQTIQDHIAYGIGYAQAEERLFQMEVLRRAAEGRLADLLGPDYVQMDELTRRDSETDAERTAAINNELTAGEREALGAYADGINAVIARDSSDPNALPAGFTLTQDMPIAPWTVNDTLAVLILEVKNVAESAGNELGYASLARRLAAHYGVRKAVAILDDVQFTHRSGVPTTVPHRAGAQRSTDRFHYDFIHYSSEDTAKRIAGLGPDVEAADQAMLTGAQAEAQATAKLGLPVFGSNAWAIAPRRSTTGGALLWGAPQVSYYVPEVLDELEIEGGPVHVHGVGVPGGGPGIVIGYTPHTAWSITTAQDDQVDTYVDHIRPAAGGGYEYRWRGSWHPVQQRTETISVRTNAPPLPLVGTRAAPVYTQKRVTFYRTVHGPPGAPLPCVVVYLDAKAGVSYCKVRAFWNSELLTGRALVAVNQATGLGEFDRAVRQGVAGFNFVYADDAGHIGYWHTGRIPIRARGADPRLPQPGDGRFDWRGYLDPKRWPSVVDPAQGYIASWNNKPQDSWDDSGDGSLWGEYQRVRQPMSLLSGSKRFSQQTAWKVAQRTGELDLRATLGFKAVFLRALAHRRLAPIERTAVAQVRAWDGTAFAPGGVEHGADGKPTGKVAAPAFAIMEAWFKALERRAGAPVFGPVVNAGKGIAAGVRAFTQTPQTTSPEFEFYDDYDSFLFNVLTGRAHAARYLGRAGAAGIVRQALDDAINQLRGTQGNDASKWRADMPQIVFQDLDVSDIPTIDWENRGTWAQAVALNAPR
jgi:penicillin amidase